MENKYAEVQNEFDSLEGIYDVEWFKFKLASDNLLTPELEDFIRQYLRFYNERK